MVTRLERRVCPHAVSGKMFWLCAITYIIALFGRMSYSAVMVALIANGSMDGVVCRVRRVADFQRFDW